MRHLLCITLFLVSFTAVQAKGSRNCRIVFLNAPADAPKTLQLFDGKQCQEVELPRINFSPVYQILPGSILLKMLSVAETDPEKVSPDAPSVSVPEAVTDFYLLVSADPANLVAPVKLEIIDATEFTQGQMLWHNLTANRLDGQIGTQKLALDGNSQIILNPPATANEDYNVNLSFFKPASDVPQPLCETKWHHDPQVRNVFFVVSKEGERTPRVMGFRDQREPVKKAGKR